MSVIDTKMDIPKGCWSCSNLRALDPETDVCKLTGERVEDRLSLSYTRHDTCPFKTVEGLLDKVEHCLDGMVANDSVISGAISTRDMIVKIIKEYCEVKE